MMQTESLTVGYAHHPVVADITLRVAPGQIITLIGPNGAGKSTILKTIANQLAPLAGTVYLAQQDMATLNEGDVAKQLSILMTEHIRPELMTCQDIVSAGRYPYTGRLGILSRQDKERVEEAMDLVHVTELRHCDFNQISDGQRQRVMLARAICQEPRVLLLDEPTSFLDIRHKLELLSLLKQLIREKQLAVVISLHELDLAQKISDQVVCIANGKVDRLGTPEEIFSGSYIQQLYGVTVGSYNGLYGSLELSSPSGAPEIFIIGGGGAGMAVYRKLQRAGIPFAVGVLHENDVEWPAAQALAAQVVAEKAFEPISATAVQTAMALMAKCCKVICCVEQFGTMNRGNQQLLERAQAEGWLIEA